MATGSHSAVLIAASHSHTFTDHTNQTSQSRGDFIMADKEDDICLRYGRLARGKANVSFSKISLNEIYCYLGVEYL